LAATDFPTPQRAKRGCLAERNDPVNRGDSASRDGPLSESFLPLGGGPLLDQSHGRGTAVARLYIPPGAKPSGCCNRLKGEAFE
jgi:hypothetical protein